MKAWYAITITKGIADIASKEVHDITGVYPRAGDNILYASLDMDRLYDLILWGRTIYKVIHILDQGSFRDLDDLAERVEKVDLKLFGCDGSFALRTSRYGSHDFTSLDANRVVGASIYRSLVRAGYDVRVDLTNPDVEYILRIVGDEYLFGVNVVGESLHIRRYRVYNHPASIKTSLASALIYISGYSGEVFIDPMAGGGTIPIEAAMIKYRIAPGLYRESHPLIRIPYYDAELYFEKRREAGERRFEEVFGEPIIYNDISPRYMQGAIRNAESAGVDRYITFMSYDARELSEYIPSLEGGTAVFNPPYGIRMTRKDVIYELYRDVVSELKILGVRKIVAITSEARLFRNALEENGYRIGCKYVVLHGKLTTHIICGGI